MKINCFLCNKEFDRKRSEISKTNFCSRDCWKNYNKSRSFLGKKFYYLEVIERVDEKLWNCLCKCGGQKILTTNQVVSEKVKSCGCLKLAHTRTNKNLENMKFNKLSHKYKNHYYWECLCDCGRIKTVVSYALINGNTKSCGCIKGPKRTDVSLGCKNLSS